MKEGDFDRALEKFDAAMKIMGYQAELAYNVALCYYRMKQYAPPPPNVDTAFVYTQPPSSGTALP